MTTQKYIEFFNTYFKPVYADLISFLADKPAQVVIELENSLSHLIVHLDTNQSEEVREDNLTKAYNHLLRVTIDCYKMLWVEMHDSIANFIEEDNRKFTINLAEHEALQLWSDFKVKAREARNSEIKNTGISPIGTIEQYKDVVEIGWNLLNSCDYEKLTSLKKFQILDFIKKQWIGFFLGIVSSIVATVIISSFS